MFSVFIFTMSLSFCNVFFFSLCFLPCYNSTSIFLILRYLPFLFLFLNFYFTSLFSAILQFHYFILFPQVFCIYFPHLSFLSLFVFHHSSTLPFYPIFSRFLYSSSSFLSLSLSVSSHSSSRRPPPSSPQHPPSCALLI